MQPGDWVREIGLRADATAWGRRAVRLALAGLFVVSCGGRPSILLTSGTIPDSSESELRIQVGDSRQLRADYSRVGQNGSCAHDRHASPTEPDLFTWSSDQPAVAAVSQTGLVTAVQIGRARVSVQADGGSAQMVIDVVPRPATSRSTPERAHADADLANYSVPIGTVARRNRWPATRSAAAA